MRTPGVATVLSWSSLTSERRDKLTCFLCAHPLNVILARHHFIFKTTMAAPVDPPPSPPPMSPSLRVSLAAASDSYHTLVISIYSSFARFSSLTNQPNAIICYRYGAKASSPALASRTAAACRACSRTIAASRASWAAHCRR